MELMHSFEEINEYMPVKSLELRDSKNLKRKERCDSFIFPARFSCKDIEKINKQVAIKLQNFHGILNLYDTGKAPELLAVTKYCFENDISLVVWHYDESSSSYFPQMM